MREQYLKKKKNYEKYSLSSSTLQNSTLLLHNKVKEEIKNVTESGIITRDEKPIECVNNIVAVHSPKELRNNLQGH